VVPELPSWLADVAVTVGPVPGELGGDPLGSGGFWRATPGHFLLDVPGVARYLVSHGRRLEIEPSPGAAAADVIRFARATPLAALCYQRGVLTFHAAAAARGRDAVLLAGDSTSGKSTLLAELLGRGWRLLSDDVAPITLTERGNPMVMPTSAHLVLWPDAVERLGWGGCRDAGNGPGGQRIFAVADRFADAPVQLQSVWLLRTSNHEAVETEVIRGMDAFDALGSMTYNTRIARAVLGPAAFMRSGAAVAGAVTVCRVRRPRGPWTVEHIADLVEAGGGAET
jgi:hypothetical protein